VSLGLTALLSTVLLPRGSARRRLNALGVTRAAAARSATSRSAHERSPRGSHRHTTGASSWLLTDLGVPAAIGCGGLDLDSVGAVVGVHDHVKARPQDAARPDRSSMPRARYTARPVSPSACPPRHVATRERPPNMSPITHRECYVAWGDDHGPKGGRV